MIQLGEGVSHSGIDMPSKGLGSNIDPGVSYNGVKGTFLFLDSAHEER